jgi:RNA polymerase sigma-70 factor (ECF subfamily)
MCRTVVSRDRVGGEGLGADDLEALVSQAAPDLYRFALSLTGVRADAEDLVQETFLRALEKRDTFRGDASLKTWMHRILHHLAIDRGRRPDREVPLAQVEEKWRDDAYTVDSAAVVERAETRDELHDALVRLPFIYRSAVVLHDVEGWTMNNVAEAQGVALPAAKQRLRRGRMMLVTALAGGAERRVALRGVPLGCWDARRRVSEYLNGDLDREEAALIERHLGSCPTCPPLYVSLVGVHAQLGRLRDPDSVVPPRLQGRIRTALRGTGG